MRKQPPARYVVRPIAARQGRAQTLWLALAWVLSLAAAVLVTYLLSHPGAGKQLQDATAAGDTGPLAARNDALRQQLADLRQSRSVDRVSTRKLQQSLAARDQTINGLRADLAFYTRLVGGAQRGGLQVQGVHLTPVPHSPHAWNLALILTRNARDKSEVRGTVRLSVQGIRGQKITRLKWTALAGDQPAHGLPFHFKYFQQLQATLMLPAGFTPNKLHVTVIPHGGDTISKHVTWADALKKAGTTDVQ